MLKEYQALEDTELEVRISVKETYS